MRLFDVTTQITSKVFAARMAMMTSRSGCEMSTKHFIRQSPVTANKALQERLAAMNEARSTIMSRAEQEL